MKFERDQKVNLNFQPTEISAIAPTDGPQVSIFATVHRALRGRYLWAGALAAVFGAVGATVGFNLTEPLYTSNGLVEVLSKINPILHDIKENERLDAFDSVVSAQATYISSDRILDHATNSVPVGQYENLIAAGWPASSEGLSLLQSSLQVSRKRGERVIRVGVTHVDPKLAKLALDAILESYMKIYGERESKGISARETSLREYRKDLVIKLNSAREDIAIFTEEFGTSDLAPLRDARFTEILEFNRRITEVREQLITARALTELDSTNADDPESMPAENGDPEQEAIPQDPYSVDNLASVDTRLADLIAQRNSIQATLKSSRLDFGPAHIKIRDIKRALAQVESRIGVRTKEIIALVESGQLRLIEKSLTNDTQSIEALEAMLTKYEELAQETQEKLSSINATRAKIRQSQEDQARYSKYLDEATNEIDAIELESQNVLDVGRIRIASGLILNKPTKDRRKPLALLGGGTGVGLGIGIIWLFGFLRPAYRYIDELEGASQTPLIGTLPDLSNPQPEQMAVASLSIHHLRNMLSLRSGAHQRDTAVTYMLTSARPGDGKTSISLALGMSFASEGMRTLLLDLDLVGRGLSRSLGLDQNSGFVDILGNDRIDGQIHSTQVKNLWMIPVGANSACRPEELPAGELRRILEILQNDFDVILIDTGPLMGSLEANVAASIVDETILIVPHGQKPRIVEAALDRLVQIGGHCAGIVFNRVNEGDLARSISQGSFHSQSIRELDPQASVPVRPPAEASSINNPKALALAIMESANTSDVAPSPFGSAADSRCNQSNRQDSV